MTKRKAIKQLQSHRRRGSIYVGPYKGEHPLILAMKGIVAYVKAINETCNALKLIASSDAPREVKAQQTAELTDMMNNVAIPVGKKLAESIDNIKFS